ncbi:uncharacterized protein L969DRAFT_612468 [Mixia osmundae IAM 14324]|uniref:Translation initiation factor eIF2B subunit gamma n=1 Tax=Mixia osmundae (strain CBS 9802 / IAM 14324 / JCM 22182 / KY 12970) TaxID=764103 RepID=G7DW28_MIXOS|nr:uncharacterized protein L969DRAFT_612468 [Mixia osmundae IAM 14324]KEI36466.1 hypothetical protein L969DRAFT_612468 [Mixia osmundae IAM 14324]GAA94834.1 hypothetical protein E5Q_01488 [Mixia osmundae IAM 14324]
MVRERAPKPAKQEWTDTENHGRRTGIPVPKHVPRDSHGFEDVSAFFNAMVPDDHETGLPPVVKSVETARSNRAPLADVTVESNNLHVRGSFVPKYVDYTAPTKGTSASVMAPAREKRAPRPDLYDTQGGMIGPKTGRYFPRVSVDSQGFEDVDKFFDQSGILPPSQAPFVHVYPQPKPPPPPTATESTLGKRDRGDRPILFPEGQHELYGQVGRRTGKVMRRVSVDSNGFEDVSKFFEANVTTASTKFVDFKTGKLITAGERDAKRRPQQSAAFVAADVSTLLDDSVEQLFDDDGPSESGSRRGSLLDDRPSIDQYAIDDNEYGQGGYSDAQQRSTSPSSSDDDVTISRKISRSQSPAERRHYSSSASPSPSPPRKQFVLPSKRRAILPAPDLSIVQEESEPEQGDETFIATLRKERASSAPLQTTTRSGRNSVRPGKWWAGDRSEYKRGDSQGLVLSNVVRKPDDEPARPKRRALTAAPSQRSVESEPTPTGIGRFDGWDDDTSSTVEVLDRSGNVVTETLVCTSSMRDLRPIRDGKIRIEPLFDFASTSGALVLTIPPTASRKNRMTVDNRYFFYVTVGCLRVTIHNKSMTVSEAGLFVVPPNNVYSIENTCDVEAKLMCVQVREDAEPVRAKMFEEPTAGPSRLPIEFQIVILSGPGNDLYPLVDPDNAHSLPKCLLPVANRPLLEGPLELAEEAGFYDVIVLAPQAQQAQLSSYLRSRRSHADTSSTKLRIDLHCFPDGSNDEEQHEELETAGVLAWATRQHLIKTDFLVLPCDLRLAPDSGLAPSLGSLVDRHRVDDNYITTLYYERRAGGEERLKDGLPPVLVTLDPATSTLLDQKELADFDEEIVIRASLLKRFPSPLYLTTLATTHIYICSKRVLEILPDFPARSSFRDDVVPWICKAQWQPKLAGKAGIGNALTTPKDLTNGGLARSSTLPPPGHIPLRTEAAPEKPRQPIRPPVSRLHSVYAAQRHTSALHRQPMEQDTPDITRAPSLESTPAMTKQNKVAIYVWRKSHGFCIRGNTVKSYIELNRYALRSPSTHAAGHQGASSTVSADSLVAQNTTMGEKSMVRRSIVGKLCTLSSGCKVLNSVLMDSVVVGENVKLENCVVGKGARIGDRSVLKDCQVGAMHEIAPETEATGDQMVAETEV